MEKMMKIFNDTGLLSIDLNRIIRVLAYFA
jgi:hypothetical protein